MRTTHKFQKVLFVFPLLVLTILLINTRFTLWPEMVVYPYLNNVGFTLYKDLINPYPPTFILALSLFSKVFNYSILSYQLLAWAFALLVNVLVFYLSLKIWKNPFFAFLSSCFFAIFAIPFGINELWFELVQTPLVIISIYFLLTFSKSKNLAYLDYSLSLAIIAFFIKQQALWLIIFYAIYLIIYKHDAIKHLLRLQKSLLTLLVIISAFTIYLVNNGNLEYFTFWTLYFPIFKASAQKGYVLLPTLRQLAVIVALFCYFVPLLSKKENRQFLLVSIPLLMFAYPRFDYFHLVPLFSVLALAAGKNLGLFSTTHKILKIVSSVGLFVLIFFAVNYYLNNWNKEVRFFENNIISAAKFLEITTSSNDYIYIQNGPDQLLPLAQRIPPKPWADEFPWYLEVSDTQNNVIQGMKLYPPKFIVYKPYEKGEQYDIGAYQPIQIRNFIDSFYKETFQIDDTLWLKTKKLNL